MALDPDDLLIFKTREEEKERELSKKQKKKPDAQKPEEAAAPAPAPQPKVKVKPVPKQKQAPQPVEEEPSYYTAPPTVEPTYPDFATEAMEVSGAGEEEKGTQVQKRRRMDSREIASHMTCELHPWRKAYAICSYCKRAFCYEDIIESGGKYYCFDDIERVPETVRRSQLVKYNNMGILSALFYFAAFMVFIYYSVSSTSILLTTAGHMGFLDFIRNISSSTAFFLGEIVFALAALVAGFFILISTENSYRLSAVCSILGVALFSYQYVVQNKLYLAIIPALLFIAFILLSYSRVAYETVSEEGIIERSTTSGVAKSSY